MCAGYKMTIILLISLIVVSYMIYLLETHKGSASVRSVHVLLTPITSLEASREEAPEGLSTFASFWLGKTVRTIPTNVIHYFCFFFFLILHLKEPRLWDILT